MADDSQPGGRRRRAGRDRPEAALGTREPGPAGDDEYAPAGDDELEPAEEDEYEDEPAGDELELAGGGDRPVGDGYEAEEDEPGPVQGGTGPWPAAAGTRDGAVRHRAVPSAPPGRR